MEDQLQAALREALEASEREVRARRDAAVDAAAASTFNRDIGGVTVNLDLEGNLPPIVHRPHTKRTVGNALAELPGGVVLKTAWITLREVAGLALTFFLVAVALSMWQTAPPTDAAFATQDASIITSAVAAVVLRIGWIFGRRAVIDALVD